MPKPPRRSFKAASNGFQTSFENGVAPGDNGTNGGPSAAPPSLIRCAIYTRKSTSEGLDQAFNSLDAQREAGESFIASQKHNGWQTMPDRYDDGGFSGGSMDRPALARLMTDIEAGEVDCVVVYKVDRLSRSLLDFARLIQLFEQRKVHFVSVTQHFNTADSMGRLTLNILLSFAQFEREIISERTRDKIAAARKRGQWVGGRPVLGYDLDRPNHKLLVNEAEATQVKALFELYLEHGSLSRLAEQLRQRRIRTKQWVDSNGHTHGGLEFTKTTLGHTLSNVVYLGKVRHRQDVFEGQHPAIIDQDLWDRVQALLDRNHRTAGSILRNHHGALLKGLLRCKACEAAMIHAPVSKDGRLYRYYVCVNAQKRGHDACPEPNLKAEAIERAVLERVRALPLDRKALSRSPAAGAAVALLQDHDLPGAQQGELLALLLEWVEYDAAGRKIALTLTGPAARCLRRLASA